MDGMGIGISEIQGVYFSGDIYIYVGFREGTIIIPENERMFSEN